ncbi:hypothetical protein CTAYLR_003512 [Chrysophaeum taylorii]|uniref:CCT-eta n=1 Tax=Chrysophaeum taylorii TaxID=2483200 RepID=A0AAD7UC21_9STRA|nr:hypothetical protein CTAYLR_003512 [Chrysophaeum taylorii]
MRTAHGMQPGIILLREGTDSSQGKAQLISNINACAAVADAVRTTLGPRGMDKLLYDGKKVTISNDGATIMKLLDIAHPAAKVLAEISTSQDAEVGDGTTSVVLLAGEILARVKPFVEDGLHPRTIARGVRKAASLAVARLHEISVALPEERKRLEVLAATALNSKLIANHKSLFAPMVVDAILALDTWDLSLVGVKKVPGGSVSDSFFVDGVAFKKTFSYAGFEQQPKFFENPKALLLNVELELKSEKENAEVRITDPDDYQSIVDAEWRIIYEKLEKCIESGAEVVLSKLPIGDLATQYFADRGVFCAGRVTYDDMERVSRATGGRVQTSVLDLNPSILGSCANFEERQVGGERYNVFTGCPKAKTATIVLRGGSEQFIEESHRSIHDALMIAKRGLEHSKVVGGGGAVEMKLSRHLREYALKIAGKDQLVISAVAQALEIIPRQLALNAGFDATDVLNALRKKHADAQHTWFGVDCYVEGVVDTLQAEIWEPALNKANALFAASEAATLILQIDETKTASRDMLSFEAAPVPSAVSEVVAMLGVPFRFVLSDLIGLLEPFQRSITRVRVSRSIDATNTAIVLLTTRCVEAAKEVYATLHGRAFNSFEPDVCELAFVEAIEWETAAASDPPEEEGDDRRCVVCLEPLEDQLFTTACDHTFHTHCLAKWRDAPCPVCRYDQVGSQAELASCCDVCNVAVDESPLWVCLLCGHCGCEREHALAHYESTKHAYALDVQTRYVWDFAGEGFVHRLALQKTDEGILQDSAVPVGFVDEEEDGRRRRRRRRLDSDDDDDDDDDDDEDSAAVRRRQWMRASTAARDADHRKLEGMAVEFNELLRSQLARQREIYESRLNALRAENDEKIRAEIVAMKRDIRAGEAKRAKLNKELAKLREELDFTNEVNKSLEQDLHEWQRQSKEADEELKRVEAEGEAECRVLEEEIARLMARLDEV